VTIGPRAHRVLANKPLATVVATLIALTAIITPSAASANGWDYTHFRVLNYSGHRLELAWIEGSFDFQARSPDGAVAAPGGDEFFNLWWSPFLSPNTTPVFNILDEHGGRLGQLRAKMGYPVHVYMQPYVECHTTYGVCSPSGGQRDGSSVILLDPPNSSGQQPVEALKSLCEHDTAATCKFRATGVEEHVQSPRHQVGHTIENHDDTEQTYSVTLKDSVSETDNIGVTAKIGGKLIEIINYEISVTYGHSWTHLREFSESLTVKVPPHYKLRIVATEPLLKDCGEFIVKLGNTTWTVRDACFFTPDRNPQEGGTWIAEVTPIGDHRVPQPTSHGPA
jgi:hypothetical protein